MHFNRLTRLFCRNNINLLWARRARPTCHKKKFRKQVSSSVISSSIRVIPVLAFVPPPQSPTPVFFFFHSGKRGVNPEYFVPRGCNVRRDEALIMRFVHGGITYPRFVLHTLEKKKIQKNRLSPLVHKMWKKAFNFCR